MSPQHSVRPAQPRLREKPSFSAALLDAIYHSLDDEGSVPVSQPEGSSVTGRRHSSQGNLSPSICTVRSPRLQKPPRPCRVQPDPQPSLLLPPPLPESTTDSAEKKRSGKKNKKTKSAPFACLLNAILCNRRSAKSVEQTTPRALTVAPAVTAEPASARSILSSRASRRQSALTGGILTPARRAVRFSPVAVVVDDEHGSRDAGVTRLRGAGMEMTAAQQSAPEGERRVEELLRALGVAKENGRAKESSESSSDLFELDSLPAFDDAELPRPRAAPGGLVLARPRARVFRESQNSMLLTSH